jgi:hypothetical protein
MVGIGTCLKPVGNISQKRERANLLDLGIYGRIILKRILRKLGVMVWTEFNRLRIKVVGLFNTVSTFISHAIRCVSGSGKQLQACEGICCMKIVFIIIIIIIIFVLTSKYVWNE